MRGLIIAYLLLTAINLFKAFHIDDSFHLEAAQWVQANPLRPLSGFINWADSPHSLCESNHPPLYFYLLAAVGSVFGYNEIPLHLLQSLFSLLALFFFYKICQNLGIGKRQNALLLLFAACPVFLVNQNIMMDTPLLALSLAAVFFMIRAQDERVLFHFSMAGFCLGLALMIKYSALPLLVVFAFAIFVKRRFLAFFALLIPLSFLVFWAVWTASECGESQILSRPFLSMQPMRILLHALALWVCMGALMPFSLLLSGAAAPRAWVQKLIFIGFSLIFLSFFLFFLDWVSAQYFNLWLHLLFVVNGALLFLYFIYRNYQLLSFFKSAKSYPKYVIILLAFWGLMAFFILFAPFMASRHALLLLPFFLMLFGEWIEKVPKKMLYLSLFATFSLGLVLGISDWQYAHHYRKVAADFPIIPNTKVWTVGHWGWQWYSQQKGLLFYDAKTSKPQANDLFVLHAHILHSQTIAPNIKLDTLFYCYEKPDFFSSFSVSNKAQLYRSSSRLLPWHMSRQAIDTVFVCRVLP